MDEVTAAFVVCFSPDGQRLLGGYSKSIAVFDTSRPGRDYKKVNTHVKKKKESSLPGERYFVDINLDVLAHDNTFIILVARDGLRPGV